MTVIQFKLTYPEDKGFVRVIETRADQTFETFHNAISKAMDFHDQQLASFYICDADWNKEVEITLLDMSDGELKIPTMNKTHLSEFFTHQGQKAVYVYDFNVMWTFQIEVTGIHKKTESKIKYPHFLQSTGKLPKKHETKKNKAISSDILHHSGLEFDDRYSLSDFDVDINDEENDDEDEERFEDE